MFAGQTNNSIERRVSRMGWRPARCRRRPGFTLLELMLALALTAIVLALLNMAIDLHLRSLDSRRKMLEESQLARSVLRIISDDIRAVVQAYEQDVSSVEAALQSAAQAAAQQVTGGGTSPSGAGGNAPPQEDDRSSSAGQTPAPVPAVAEAASFSASGTSGSTASSGSGMGASMSDDPNAASTATTPTTSDLAAATSLSSLGVFGNQYQLQMDVSRLPRVEQYQQYVTEDSLTALMDIPSDVKTVTYYVKAPPAVDVNLIPASAASGAMSLEQLDDPNANASGLVRRVLDRAVTSAAMEGGNLTGLENSGELIAPEVTGVEFRYFDGMEWRLEWDTSVEETLPLAIQVLLAISSDVPATSAAADAGLAGQRLYSMIIHLPMSGLSGGGSSSSATSSTSTGGL